MSATPCGLRRTVPLSLALHALALASAFPWHWPAMPEPDEPARIEVWFGTGGTRLPMTAVGDRPKEPADTGAIPRPPDGVAPSAPVPGLRTERPDPLMLPARDDPGNRGPAYPVAALRLRQQGTVLLRLYIGADGAVTRVETRRSSGVAALDAAAVAALSAWRFLPAERAGQPIASYRDQPVSFVLD